MATRKVNEDQLMRGLTQVFRTFGLEGASLTKLTEATGLQRASLYHRFPGGKEEMVVAVLQSTLALIQEQILDPLNGPGSPRQRLEKMSRAVAQFYANGEKACLFDYFSIAPDSHPIREHVNKAMRYWLECLTKVACEAGIKKSDARRRAEDVTAAIQGSLVMARAMNDRRPFRRMVKELPDRLLGD